MKAGAGLIIWCWFCNKKHDCSPLTEHGNWLEVQWQQHVSLWDGHFLPIVQLQLTSNTRLWDELWQMHELQKRGCIGSGFRRPEPVGFCFKFQLPIKKGKDHFYFYSKTKSVQESKITNNVVLEGFKIHTLCQFWSNKNKNK